MKTEELKAQGLTDAQIAFVMAENGRDIKNAQKDLETVTADRDKWKQTAETAEATLKGFDGVDVEKMKADIESYKQKAEEAEASYQAKIADRDFSDALTEAIRSAGGLNATAIKSLLKVEELKASKNQKEDIAAALEALQTADDSKMLFRGVQTEAEKKKAQFTKPSGSGDSAGGTVTKDSIMAIKDRGERRRAIAQHLELFSGAN